MLRVAALLLCSASSLTAQEIALVDRFDHDVQNRLGGYRSGFSRTPSQVRAMRVTHPRRGEGGRSMRIRTNKQSSGFCGLWIHLFDMRADSPRFFNAQRYEALSFWVKGEHGGERFQVQLADRRWHDKQDSLPLGDIASFLPAGEVTREWQEAIVPLATARLNRSELATLVFNCDQPSKQTVYVDDVCFKSRADAPAPSPSRYQAPKQTSAKRERSMWVWCSRDVLANKRREDDLFEFCRVEHIDVLWMQLTYQIDRANGQAHRCRINEPQAWRRLLARAHREGIQVHALDGYPEFALRSHHATPLAVVDAVLRFNDESPETARFDGIHFDNEPYLLLGWHDKQTREQILRELLELCAECQRRARSREDLVFGVDIPFWWQAEDEQHGGHLGDVHFRGERKPASHHLIDMLDNVGVMNYRDQADGADGMIAHARELLEYADRAQGAKLDLGVETFAYEPTPVWFAVGRSKPEFLAQLRAKPGAAFAKLSRYQGARLRTLDDGERVHIGIELSPALRSADGEPNTKAAKILAELARAFAPPDGQCADAELERRFVRIHEHVEHHADWRRLQRRDLPREQAGFVLESRMLSKITFADDNFATLTEQVSAADEFFLRYSSYHGVAIHCFAAAQALKSQRPKTSANIDP